VWLDTLQRLQEAPSTRTVYLLGIPIARQTTARRIKAYKSRNKVRTGIQYRHPRPACWAVSASLDGS
jgi:hypothetical protein